MAFDSPIGLASPALAHALLDAAGKNPPRLMQGTIEIVDLGKCNWAVKRLSMDDTVFLQGKIGLRATRVRLQFMLRARSTVDALMRHAEAFVALSSPFAGRLAPLAQYAHPCSWVLEDWRGGPQAMPWILPAKSDPSVLSMFFGVEDWRDAVARGV